MTWFRRLSICGGALCAISLAGCGNGAPTSSNSGTSAPAAGTASATLSGTVADKVNETDALKFEPATTTAKVGDIIEFTNAGTVQHNVTFDDPNSALSSQTMQQGDTWMVKFTAAGTYNFHCTFHLPNMTGTITVS